MDILQKKKKIRTERNIPSSGTKGTLFRLWAPNADKVSVIGDFNDFKEGEDLMLMDEKGQWSLRSENAQIGQRYKFVIHNGNQKLYKSDPYALETTREDSSSIISKQGFQWTDHDFQIADRHKLVIYQLDVGSFFGRNGQEYVDLNEVAEQLSFLKILGINAIEITLPSALSTVLPWAHHPSRPMTMCHEMGGAKAFANLINVAHSNDIAVIIGIDFSHFDTSDPNLWQFDGWSENGKGGIYFYNDERSSTPWGDTRPDYGRWEVRKFIRDSVFRWLDDYHCDGACISNTNFVRHTSGYMDNGEELDDGIRLLKEINGEIKIRYPHKLTIAEDQCYRADITVPIVAGGLGFDAQRNPEFVRSICQVLKMPHDGDRCMQSVVDALEVGKGKNPFRRVVYCESRCCMEEDDKRLPKKMDSGRADRQFARKRATLATVLTLTAPGIPMLFQGQALLTDRYFINNEELDWNTFGECQGIVKLFSDVIKLRKSHYSDFAGLQGDQIDFLHCNQADQILAYQRVNRDYPHSRLVVVINFSKKDYKSYTLGLPSNGLWKLVFNSSSTNYDPSFCNLPVTDFKTVDRPFEGHGHSGTFGLPCYGALMFINRG